MNIIYMTQEELFEKYNDLFKRRKLSIKESCMPWGIECGEGWYQLIDILCQCLERVCKQYNCSFEFEQVKEKYGTLTIYWYASDSTSDIAYVTFEALVDFFQRKSKKICERDGNPGRLCVKSGWFKTLCKDCADKLAYSYL